MGKQYRKALWWVKRDFRLVDNEAYARALSESEDVLPVFCYEPLLLAGPDWGKFHTYALWQGQTSLRKNLQAFGSDLYVSQDDVLPTFERIKREFTFDAIFAHEETGLAHTFARDKAAARWCKEQNITFIEVKNNGVTRRLRSRDLWEKEFKTFITSPEAQVPRTLSLSAEARALAIETQDPTTGALSIDMLSPTLPVVSEGAAHALLTNFFTERVQGYSGGISAMNKAVTHSSHISVHLAWGTISLRHVFNKTQKMREMLAETGGSYQLQRSLTSFKSRLYWHGHFVQKLEDEVAMELRPVNAAYAETLPFVEGEEAARRLFAWEAGTTGYPMIDASMRYFRTHGWLNFRSRAMVTSFAVHALRLHWQTVMYRMAPFMIDYVPGIHVAQVQMQAGLTGANTIRVYSPMKQMEDQDPEARFIKEQLQELAQFSAEDIAAFETKELGIYPRPIINFKAETKIMKDSLYGIKKSAFGREEGKRVFQKHGSRRKWGSKRYLDLSNPARVPSK